MQGVAKGASLRLSEIIMINARTEILQLAEKDGSLQIRRWTAVLEL